MSSVLPPGCWFRPSEDQLLTYYLTNKNRTGRASAAGAARSKGYDLIRELELYDYSPFELPEITCYEYCRHGRRRRHWYCYAGVRALAEESRKAKGGFWIMRGRARGIFLPGGDALIGTRKKFVYHSGESDKSAVRTDWVLYEYALVNHAEASFVLCRVFIKSHFGNTVSENVLSPSAEVCAPAVSDIGFQHDGFLIPHSSVDILDKMSRDLRRVKARLIPAVDFSFPSSIERNERVGTFESTARNNLDTESDQRTPEDDFIELDDLKD